MRPPSFRFESWVWLACLGLMLLAPSDARARGLSTPSFHWGSIEVPTLENAGMAGFSIIQFTEFDKKQFPPTDPNGELVRYNDIGETYGFSLFTFSKTRQLRGRGAHQSNLYFTPSFTLGVSHDPITEFYQNDIIHEVAGLDPIQRGDVDHGLVLAYGGELNYQFLQLARDRQGQSLLRKTPLFVGGGFSVGTILQDLYVHAGVARLRWPQLGTRNHVLHLDFSVVGRLGFLVEGFDFEELAQEYVATQATVGLTIAPYRFPVRLEYGLTGHSGPFLASKAGLVDTVYGDPAARRSPLREIYSSFRLGLGSWTFEAFNDMPGDKDRGPTYGARFWITTNPGEKWYQTVFDSILLRWL